MIYVFWADGFEETEAIAPIDMLRRANKEVVTVGVTGEYVTSSHAVQVKADSDIKDLVCKDVEMIVLPGGAVGVENLDKSERVHAVIDECYANKIPIAAICAAPSILAKKGLLNGIKATSYPSFRQVLIDNGAIIGNEPVISDGIFTTAAAAGVSIEFGLELVRILCGEKLANKIGDAILF